MIMILLWELCTASRVAAFLYFDALAVTIDTFYAGRYDISIFSL